MTWVGWFLSVLASLFVLASLIDVANGVLARRLLARGARVHSCCCKGAPGESA